MDKLGLIGNIYEKDDSFTYSAYRFAVKKRPSEMTVTRIK
jgi:hypothetical protein